jgi:shikimate dehydrogenase
MTADSLADVGGPEALEPGLLDAVTSRFAADEMLGRAAGPGRMTVAAAGTLAEASIRSPLLDAACHAAGIEIDGRSVHADLAGLLSAPDWDLALVLSPLKGQAAGWCDQLAPRAAATGVADTLVRARGQVVGYNTNSHAWAAAAARLMGADVPERILVVGSGATARSVTCGALRAFPQARVGVAARSQAAAAALVSEYAGSEYVPDPGGFAPSLVAHVTTVGEQDDERPLEVPLAAALRPGTRVFDLTNRLSALQRQALAAGCITMSGNLMQLLTNILRAAITGAR